MLWARGSLSQDWAAVIARLEPWAASRTLRRIEPKALPESGLGSSKEHYHSPLEGSAEPRYSGGTAFD
ncbi:hypothetical protein NDU88_004971 [Pleurodeles waltl]|uniref:Uncharacterized protein n=1 Tax=Pleurodeles waltl TaxID=8319 RepID=A0AAV7LK66_PLEWA|nr:hypothetical protein NDU88_004971 [Pleurodeles waltl]